jgi:hypothetical protein
MGIVDGTLVTVGKAAGTAAAAYVVRRATASVSEMFTHRRRDLITRTGKDLEAAISIARTSREVVVARTNAASERAEQTGVSTMAKNEILTQLESIGENIDDLGITLGDVLIALGARRGRYSITGLWCGMCGNVMNLIGSSLFCVLNFFSLVFTFVKIAIIAKEKGVEIVEYIWSALPNIPGIKAALNSAEARQSDSIVQSTKGDGYFLFISDLIPGWLMAIITRAIDLVDGGTTTAQAVSSFKTGLAMSGPVGAGMVAASNILSNSGITSPIVPQPAAPAPAPAAPPQSTLASIIGAAGNILAQVLPNLFDAERDEDPGRAAAVFDEGVSRLATVMDPSIAAQYLRAAANNSRIAFGQ